MSTLAPLPEAEINRLVNGSIRLRMRSADSRWLLKRGMIYVGVCGSLDEDRLRQYLTQSIKTRYGNPIAIWILLNVILPVVIKLIIEWWMNRNKDV